MGSPPEVPAPQSLQHTRMTGRAATLLLLVATAVIAEDVNIGSRHAVDVVKAEEEMRAADESIGSGKLYFTGTGYTVNLIPHVIVLGLLALGVVFLFGDSLFGADIGTGYGAPDAGYGAAPAYSAPAPSYAAAPSTGYDAANRYYDTYAQQAATALGAS